MWRVLVIFTFFCLPSFALASVLVNEIAWMGTAESSSNEWIELSNNGSEKVSLDGWVLSMEGKKDIVLSGSISADGLYLIERTDDSTIPTISADLIASFGSGLSNTGATLVLKDSNGVFVDRVDGSNAWTIGGVEAGDNTTKETAQRGVSGWFTGAPTPRAQNIAVGATHSSETTTTTTIVTTATGTSSNLSTFPVEPQIFADAGALTRTVSVGAPVIFRGRVWGLKKEPIENARMVWTFGDGARAEGVSASHVFYYPGEYTVVLDASSGYYSASDRVRVVATTPLTALHTGGTTERSFVVLENKGNDELDLSEWKIESAGKIFTIPNNTVVGAKKILTFASEITGLSTPEGSLITLLFPNGTRVQVANKDKQQIVVVPEAPVVFAEKTPVMLPATKSLPQSYNPQKQEASVLGALPSVQELPQSQENNLWGWIAGVAFLVSFVLVALRFLRKEGSDADVESIDDFEIIEEREDEDRHARH